MLHDELLRGEVLDLQRVGKTVDASVLEFLAFQYQLVAAQLPAVVLVGGVVDGGGYAVVAALEPAFSPVRVGDPSANDVAFAAVAENGVGSHRNHQHNGRNCHKGMYAVYSFHRCVCGL